MSEIQAIILTCPDIPLEKTYSVFLETELNIYAVTLKTIEGGIKTLFDGGVARDQIFSEIEILLGQDAIPKIILVGHAHCPGRSVKEQDNRELEVELRHVVSALHAKFPRQVVEAYLKDNTQFIKVI